ncbi:carboxypeptidase regulatory-like domain-containing protein [Candidatus Sumerlaeota bacterium]|nr:carboxypeptidase regulatory-like domain-containing protein [Candidatus Sumerlaeota bacterium]
MRRSGLVSCRGVARRGLVLGIIAMAVLLIIAVIMVSNSQTADITDVAKRNPTDVAKRDSTKVRAEEEKPPATIATTEAATGKPKDVASTERKGPKLRGRVVKAVDESPIAGASVSSMHIPLSSAFEMEVLDSSTSNGEGYFEIPQVYVEMSNASYEVSAFVATAEGFESQMIPAGYEESNDIVFKLGPGASITGRVTDESGSAVANVTLATNAMERLRFAGRPEYLQPQIFTHAKTAQDGTFTAKGLRVNDSYQFMIRAKGYEPFLSQETKAGASGVHFVLTRSAARIFGTVTNADGTPLKKGYVQAYPQDQIGGNMFEIMAKMRSAITDEKGVYELDSMKSGSIMLAVTRDPRNGNGGMAMRSFVLKDREEKQLDIQMPALSAVKGKAINDDTGQPLPGVFVSNEPTSGMGSLFGFKVPSFTKASKSPGVLTGGDGTFTLEGVAPSAGTGATIYFTPPPGMVTVNDSLMRNLVMVPMNLSGTFDEVTLRFRSLGRINGIVYFSGGTTPASDVNVEISSVGTFYRKSGKTNNEGRFSIEVPPSQPMQVHAKTDSASASAKATYNPEAKNEDVVLTLQSYARITGTVKDEAGNPVKGITVQAAKNSEAKNRGNPMMMMSGMGGTSSSGEDGSYTLDKIEPGPVQVSTVVGNSLMNPGSSSNSQKYSSAEPVNVDLAEGETRTGVDLLVRMGEVLEGIVMDEEKNPILDAKINVFSENFLRQASTDAEGKFKLEGVPSNAGLILQVSHPDHAPVYKQNVSWEDSPVEIVMKPLIAPQLKVVYAKGGAVSSFKYAVYQKISNTSWMPTPDLASGEVRDDDDGVTTMKAMAAGNYRVEVSELVDTGSSGRGGSTEFDIKDGSDQQQVVEVKLDTGRKIVGTVIRGEDGPPVANAEISALRINSFYASMQGMEVPPALTAMTDGKGAFELHPLLPGDIELQVKSEGLCTKDKVEITVPSDRDPEPITIVLVEGTSIFGAVTDFDGNPLPNATLTLANSDRLSNYMFGGSPGGKTTRTDAKGVYRFDGLGPGHYGLALSSNVEGIAEVRKVTAETGKDLEENFDFSALIQVTGLVTVNGTPISSDQSSLYLWQEGGTANRKDLTINADGSYSINIRPGKYSVYLSSQNSGFFGFVPGQFSLVSGIEVAETPRAQQHDITLQFLEATVALVFPSDGEFAEGNVSVSQVDSTQVPAPGMSSPATSASVRMKNLTPGLYKATYHSEDQQWYGTSEDVQLSTGGENILVVDVKKPGFRKKIGDWNEADVKKGFLDFPIDVSGDVDASGDYDVIFTYTSGDEALIIDSVALLVNGSQVQVDQHQGWSGYAKRDNIYRFNLSDYRAGSSYVLRCRYRANGSSNGEIFLAR